MTDQQPTLAIGAVLGRLTEEFPDLTLSKVRFLDAQGVVSPQRAESGYRRYTERDVERLRFVLRCQRDRFWPLKVIREALDAFDRGLEPAADQRPAVPSVPIDPDAPTVADLAEVDGGRLRLSATELATAAQLDAQAVRDIVDFGLVKPDSDGYFDAAALQIARSAGALMAHGVGARHLRPFRLAADRELGLIQQLSYGPTESDRTELMRECLALHLALVRAGLQG
ncbi:MerR family transcriptional regulator [Yimella sp. cx-573]|nr:MerR family transcriptional regulator [Yimella sp. cx-573]